MNLLGSLVGTLAAASGSGSAGQPDLMKLVSTLLAQSGGLPALIAKFQAGGLGEVVASWIGTGENLPVTGTQVGQALGPDMINGFAQQLGLSSNDLAQRLATILPQVVDQMTPKGELPAAAAGGAGELGDLAGLLGGLMKR